MSYLLKLDLQEEPYRKYVAAAMKWMREFSLDLFLKPYQTYDNARLLAAFGSKKHISFVKETPYPPLKTPDLHFDSIIEDLECAFLARCNEKVCFVPRSWTTDPRTMISVIGISKLMEGIYPEDSLDLDVWDVIRFRMRQIKKILGPKEVLDENLILEAAVRSTKVWPVLLLATGKDVTEIYGVEGSPIYIDHIEAGRVEISNLVLDEREFEKIRTIVELHPYGALNLSRPTVKVEFTLRDSKVRLAVDIPPVSKPTFDARNLSALPRLPMSRLIALGTIREELAACLVEAMYERQPILIAGRTGVGKTTLANSILAYSDKEWRIVSIEEVREIEDFSEYGLKHHPYVFPGDRESMVTTFLHRNPDLVFLGEILTEEHARAFALAKESGFRVIATTHARDPISLERKWIRWGSEDALLGCLVLFMGFRVAERLYRYGEGGWEEVEPRPSESFLAMIRATLGSKTNGELIERLKEGTLWIESKL
ncbi:MAG: hypothetical protein DRO05_01400 [Thermoproteota archaeon]|nr:MAG: hypothetical protein DRO05_01400 [Candidatus Korarchaeota archaeon]